MAYEFKRLSDVEVVAEPSESANVLIEEGGVIKKAPKTAVGGKVTEECTGNKWDAVIFCRDYIDNYNAELIQGDYSELREKLMSMTDMPNILVVEDSSSSGGGEMSLRPTTYIASGPSSTVRTYRAISVALLDNDAIDITISMGESFSLTLYHNNMFYEEGGVE